MVENALKYCCMESARAGEEEGKRPMVVVRARPATADDWGQERWVIAMFTIGDPCCHVKLRASAWLCDDPLALRSLSLLLKLSVYLELTSSKILRRSLCLQASHIGPTCNFAAVLQDIE